MSDDQISISNNAMDEIGYVRRSIRQLMWLAGVNLALTFVLFVDGDVGMG